MRKRSIEEQIWNNPLVDEKVKTRFFYGSRCSSYLFLYTRGLREVYANTLFSYIEIDGVDCADPVDRTVRVELDFGISF